MQSATELLGMIDDLPQPSPEFLGWALWANFQLVTQEEGQTFLGLAVEALLETGKARDERDALGQLNEIAAGLRHRKTITSCDLRLNEPDNFALRRLRRDLAEARGTPLSNGQLTAQRMGSIGHIAVPTLLLSYPMEPADEAGAVQPLLFPDEPQFVQAMAERTILQRADRNTIRRIRHCWQEIVHELGGAQGWFNFFWNQARIFLELKKALRPVFGGWIDELEKVCDDQTDDIYLLLITLLCWASAVLGTRRNRRKVLFREVQVLDPAFGVSVGRIDAIEVETIGERSPNERQLEVIHALARQNHFRSVGAIRTTLMQVFKKPVRLRFFDWKFYIGDVIVDPMQRLSVDVSSPAARDQRQMERYLTLAPVGEALAAMRSGTKTHEEPIWQDRDGYREGQLVYFVPTRLPQSHRVEMTPDEKAQTFIARVAQSWDPARRSAHYREISNGLTLHLCKLLKQQPAHRTTAARPTNEQLLLFENEASRFHLVEEIVNRHQQSVDRFGIITTCGVRRDGTPRLVMHIDRLIENINAGKVFTDRFNPERGGAICCIMPGHEERTPSMQVNFQRGRFHCFGLNCGVNGEFAVGSIPKELIACVTTNGHGRVKHRDIGDIPDEHTEVMHFAQCLFHYDLLREIQRGGTGAYYLRGRGIDPELAYHFGVGFGTRSFMDDLLDEYGAEDGYELGLKYGLIGLMDLPDNRLDRVGTRRRSLVPMLRKRGLEPIMALRETGTKKDGKALWGEPYFVMENRVTCPLKVQGTTTNFYGRATDAHDKKFYHRKLSIRYTGVPHGMFCIDAVDIEQADEVVITEACIDALTLAHLGLPCVRALIGVDNDVLLKEIVGLGKNIAMALDNDATGRGASAKVTEKLVREFGFKGSIRDLTQELMIEKLGGNDAKDWNAFWTTTQRI